MHSPYCIFALNIGCRKIDFMVIFSIIASGIIVFVPLYKKYKQGRYDK